MRWGEESPSHGFAVPAPFRQGGHGDGGGGLPHQFANWSRNDRFLQGVRYGIDGRTESSAPTDDKEICASPVRADVGSELSAASGRSSEVSEWPRSKFPASAVRQRRNFGHRNRIIVPYGCVAGSAVRWVTARVAPTEGYKSCGVKRNPPVTASPCQPPLGKGAEGTDCHNQ